MAHNGSEYLMHSMCVRLRLLLRQIVNRYSTYGNIGYIILLIRMMLRQC